MSKHHDIEYLIDLCQRIMDVLADVRDTNEFEQTTLLCMNLHAAAASLTRRADELAAAKIVRLKTDGLIPYGQNIGTRHFPDVYGRIHLLSTS
jgi:hypothetical protein